MHLLAQEEYGLRCLLELTRHEGKPRTIHQIAEAEGLSPDYAAKLLRELRRGGLVARSARGMRSRHSAAPSSRATSANATRGAHRAAYAAAIARCAPSGARPTLRCAACSRV